MRKNENTFLLLGKVNFIFLKKGKVSQFMCTMYVLTSIRAEYKFKNVGKDLERFRKIWQL